MDTYSDYFDIDENYYPEINPNSISDPNSRWDGTFPHETFVDLLRATERMLARETNTDKKGIWIEGAYGTGKSRVAWTLKSLLECSPEELNSYFDEYDNLKRQPDLRDKLLAHKGDHIVTVFCYGSGEVDSIRKLVMTVFEKVTKALRDSGYNYRGERTLRGKIASWISAHKEIFGLYMSRPQYVGLGSFAGNTADDIIAHLENLEQGADELISQILDMADREGIHAFDISMDDLTAWLKDVIEQNELKAIVFIWDEFSSYFKNNKTTLDEFQKLAELSNEKPFYLMIVTHMSGSLVDEGNQAFKIVRDRFIRREIEMPDSVAFDLIGHALKVRPAAQDEWVGLSDDLNSRMTSSRRQVAAVVGTTDKTLTKLFPIHPMAALLLKYISTTFASNQRSMFNFIKNPDTDDLQAFQWFINTHGPDNGDVLTIDFLWNFFYEKGTDENTFMSGRSNLDFIVATILDTYPNNEHRLNGEQRRVLKVVLMMQAISQKLNNSVSVLRPNDKNLNLAFEGDDRLENNRAISVANSQLVKMGILYIKPTEEGDEYAAAAVSGDQVQIDAIRRKRLAETRTARLISDAQLESAITYKPSIRARYEVKLACVDDFRPTVNKIINERQTYRSRAVMCFARNENEQVRIREKIKEATADPNSKDIVFIDASESVLGADRFGRWASFAANEEYWRSKDGKLADNHKKSAEDVLADWRNDVSNGAFDVYVGQLKEHCASTMRVSGVLEDLVIKRYPLSFDRIEVSEAFFTSRNLPFGAKIGIQQACGGIYQQDAISRLLLGVQNTPEYWNDPQLKSLPISKLKVQIDALIKERLDRDARISISEIYDFLEERGFMPCNLYAYLTGFLLKEYASGTFMYGSGASGDAGGRMTVERLAELIGAYMKHKVKPVRNYRDEYIEVMTQEQKRFVDFAHEAFGVSDSLSVEPTAARVRNELTNFGYPIWCLRSIDTNALDPFIEKLSEIVSKNASGNVPALTNDFGRMLEEVPTAASNLTKLFTRENGALAMREFLHSFEDGQILKVAEAIGVEDVLVDVKRQIGSGDALWLWDQEDGENELRRLLVDYRIVERSNQLITKSNSFSNCMKEWSETTKYIKIPYLVLMEKCPDLKQLVSSIYEIAKNGEISHDKREAFLEQLVTKAGALKDVLDRKKDIFAEIYSTYTDGFGAADIKKLYDKLPKSSFMGDKSAFEKSVQEHAEEVRTNQKKFQLHKLWKESTHSKDAHDWSKQHKTPLLALVPVEEREAARTFFAILHKENPIIKQVDWALKYLENKPVFLSLMSSDEQVEIAFSHEMIGKYRSILTDNEEVRRYLESKAFENVYQWCDSKQVSDAVRSLAESKYRLGANQAAIDLIDGMDTTHAKTYLKRLVRENVEVGIEIIAKKEARQ